MNDEKEWVVAIEYEVQNDHREWLEGWMPKRLSRRMREKIGLPPSKRAESTYDRE